MPRRPAQPRPWPSNGGVLVWTPHGTHVARISGRSFCTVSVNNVWRIELSRFIPHRLIIISTTLGLSFLFCTMGIEHPCHRVTEGVAWLILKGHLEHQATPLPWSCAFLT